MSAVRGMAAHWERPQSANRLAEAFSVAAAAACLNVAASLVQGTPHELRAPATLADVLGVDFLVFVGLVAVPWAWLAWAERRGARRSDAIARAASLALIQLALVGPFVYVPLRHVLPLLLRGEMKLVGSRSFWVLLAIVTVLALSSAVVLLRPAGRLARVAGSLMGTAGLLVAVQVLGVVWVWAFGPGPGATGWIALAGGVLMAAATFWAGSRMAAWPSIPLAAGLVLGGVGVKALLPAAAVEVSPRREVGSAPHAVLLITIDTLRADALGAYGSRYGVTPQIDSLARNGDLFLNARSPAPWTKPALASILTGVSPLVHRALRANSALPTGFTSLAEYLRDAGYITGFIGYNVNLTKDFGFAQGFDDFSSHQRSLGRSFAAGGLSWLAAYRDSTEGLTNQAISWMQARARQPFFLWVHLFDPHLPYSPPARFLTRRDPPRGLGRTFDALAAARRKEVAVTPVERDWVRSLYLAELRYVDENVGRLLDTVKALGLWDRALIVLTSDHGEEFWEHGGFEHGHTLFDELLLVPVVLKRPGAGAGGVWAEPVSTESVTPTILGLVGAHANPQAFTAPVLPHLGLEAPPDATSRPHLATGLVYGGEQLCLIRGSFKYVKSLEDGAERVFDLSTDPGELRPLAPAPEGMLNDFRTLASSLASDANAFRARVGPLGDEEIELGEDTLRELRALGYVQ